MRELFVTQTSQTLQFHTFFYLAFYHFLVDTFVKLLVPFTMHQNRTESVVGSNNRFQAFLDEERSHQNVMNKTVNKKPGYQRRVGRRNNNNNNNMYKNKQKKRNNRSKAKANGSKPPQASLLQQNGEVHLVPKQQQQIQQPIYKQVDVNKRQKWRKIENENWRQNSSKQNESKTLTQTKVVTIEPNKGNQMQTQTQMQTERQTEHTKRHLYGKKIVVTKNSNNNEDCFDNSFYQSKPGPKRRVGSANKAVNNAKLTSASNNKFMNNNNDGSGCRVGNVATNMKQNDVMKKQQRDAESVKNVTNKKQDRNNRYKRRRNVSKNKSKKRRNDRNWNGKLKYKKNGFVGCYKRGILDRNATIEVEEFNGNGLELAKSLNMVSESKDSNGNDCDNESTSASSVHSIVSGVSGSNSSSSGSTTSSSSSNAADARLDLESMGINGCDGLNSGSVCDLNANMNGLSSNLVSTNDFVNDSHWNEIKNKRAQTQSAVNAFQTFLPMIEYPCANEKDAKNDKKSDEKKDAEYVISNDVLVCENENQIDNGLERNEKEKIEQITDNTDKDLSLGNLKTIEKEMFPAENANEMTNDIVEKINVAKDEKKVCKGRKEVKKHVLNNIGMNDNEMQVDSNLSLIKNAMNPYQFLIVIVLLAIVVMIHVFHDS